MDNNNPLYTSIKKENNSNSLTYNIIKYASLSLISTYAILKGMIALRKKNPNIFIINKKVGGTIGKYYYGGFEKIMTKREACLILNVSDRLTIKELKEVHKKMMILNHPDSGGSTYIASKINQAKDILMLSTRQYKH